MHDIDRTMREYSQEFPSFEGEQFEFGESEWSSEGGTLNEGEVMELAGELLEVSNEAELDRFLNLVSRVTRAAGSFVRSPIGQAVGGVQSVAKKALPMAGAAIGGHIGGPLGAQIGTGLANAASDARSSKAKWRARTANLRAPSSSYAWRRRPRRTRLRPRPARTHAQWRSRPPRQRRGSLPRD